MYRKTNHSSGKREIRVTLRVENEAKLIRLITASNANRSETPVGSPLPAGGEMGGGQRFF
jgi:hypothetical protein